MKKKILTSIVLSALLSGCGAESKDNAFNEEYVAVYVEATATAAPAAELDDIELPAAYSYSYFDHILFLGDEICSGLTEHGLISEEHIISVSGKKTSELLNAQFNGTDVLTALKNADMPYIYLWSGVHDIFSGMTAEEYGNSVKETAEQIREACPDSMVIVLSNTPAAEIKGGSEQIIEFNSALKAAIKSSPDPYIIYFDIHSSLVENGALGSAYDKGDGVNLSRMGCRKVLNTIEDDRFFNDLAGDGKYMHMYKDIYCERPEYTVTEGKIAYLTFDDGPSKHTPDTLRILRENNIKATFFITGWCIDGKEDILQQIIEDGHTIGLHSWSHDYDEIYASPEAWMNDFAKVYNKVYDVTGKKAWAFRFPGGSYNNYNKPTADAIIAEMQRRGFSYFDWNAATSDATKSATYESCMEYLEESIYSDHSVVLMHDSLELTPQYLQDAIDLLKSEGYSFETIDTADEIHF